jgi:uncharacterized protein YndB with AHSA1/START domain
MAPFTATVAVAAPVDRVWARLTDWPAHSRWIPLTTVRVTSERPDGVGAGFAAFTGVGRFGFDDPMEIVEWTPPAPGRAGHCRVRKHGRVVLGWAAFEVAEGEAGGSTVRWTEDVQIVPVRLTRPADRLIAAAGRVGVRRALLAMGREVETEVGSGA